MPDTLTQLSETLIQVLGHTLWQAALISGFVWLLLGTLPAKHAERRYAIALGGLTAIVAASLVTWSVLKLDDSESPQSMTQSTTVVEQTERVLDVTSTPHDLAHASPHAEDVHRADHATVDTQASFVKATSPPYGSGRIIARWLTVIWFCGAMIMLLRGLAGFVIVRRWLVESAPAADFNLTELNGFVRELSRRLKLRRVVRIVLSQHIDTPAVVGVLWPMIMVPVSMATGVPADQWRIMIAHELAHIRRWDPLVSLIQMVIESALFFNPFVWWLNRIIRAEREACCDAVAARICGQPLSVAKTLVDVAASIHRPVISSVMAFAEPASEGELSDRVLRLVQPDRTPRSKVSWLSVTVVMVVLATTFVLLQRGTDIAVQSAANWMSPKERVEKLVQLEAERNGNFVSAATTSDGSTDSQDPNAGKIAVHLIVKTEDGSKITRKLSLHSMTHTVNRSSGSSMGGPNSEEDEYRKTHYFSPCQLQIGASHPDFAAVSSPIITLMPDDKEKTIELILTKGSSVDAMITNEQGQPISQATVKSTAILRFRSGVWSGSSAQETQTDASGRFEFSHVANSEYSIEVMANGYQRLKRKESLGKWALANSNEPFRMVLKPARPVPVRVVDRQSNQPIANATLQITHRRSSTEDMSFAFSRRWITPNPWQDYAISNSNGEAVLDQLEDNTAYTFAVVAETYGVGVLEMKADDAERTISLSPSIEISGRMIGDLQTLQKSTDAAKPGFQVSVRSRIGTAARDLDDMYWINVDPEGHFEIDRLTLGERLTLELPNEKKELQITESMTDLEIPILPKEPEPDMPVREVVIRLTGTHPEAPAQGTLFAYWNHPATRMQEQTSHNMPITSNEVRLKIPVGAFLRFGQQSLAGYRIEDQDQLEILPGTTPQIIEAKVVAVGGIYGSIKRADGSVADRASTRVMAIELPPGEKDSSKINPSSSRSGFLFMKSVPFGGRYRLLTHEQTDDTCVWAVSDEFAIDESNPIVKMDVVLPSGRDLTLRLVDEKGKPVAGQDVELNCSFSRKPGGFFSLKSGKGFGSYSFSSKTTSDPNGICVFRGLSLDHPLDGIELKLTATIEPGPYRGRKQTIEIGKTNQPIEIMLSRGLTVSGYLIDVATNKPIPNAELRVNPRDFDQSEFHGVANTKTDATGRFEFSGLEPIEYTGYVNDASPKGAVLHPYGDGSIRISYPAGVEQLSLTATDPPGEPVRWEVIIHPNSRLRSLE